MTPIINFKHLDQLMSVASVPRLMLWRTMVTYLVMGFVLSPVAIRLQTD